MAFCLIPPGAHLQRIAMHLRSNGTRLHYGDEGRWSEEELCDIYTWDRVRSGGSFSKQINFDHPNPALIQAKLNGLLENTSLLGIQVVHLPA